MITLSCDRRQALALFGVGAVFPSAARSAQTPPKFERLPEAEFGPEDALSDIPAMEDMRRRLTAPVMIDGQGPFDFVVDTGANRSIISTELAAQLALPPGRPTLVHGIATERIVQTVRVGKFAIGGRTASNLSIAILPAVGLGAAGLLGVDGLKSQRVVFDFPGSRLQIVKSSDPHRTEGGSVIQARKRFGQLTVVDTDLDGVRVSVLIDSGSESTVGNSALRDIVQRNPRAPAMQKVVISGATGDTIVGDFGSVPRFRLGSLTIANLRVAYADLHPFQLWDLTRRPALMMGMDVMRFFEEVALDYGRNEVRFRLPKTPYVDPAGGAV